MALFRKKLREVDATQAQIEAAAKAIGDLEPFEVYDCEKAAKAALTAAAQVGEPAFDYFAYYKKATDEAVNATIERCAQVADAEVKNRSLTEGAAAEALHIAAAIRKLKETA